MIVNDSKMNLSYALHEPSIMMIRKTTVYKDKMSVLTSLRNPILAMDTFVVCS